MRKLKALLLLFLVCLSFTQYCKGTFIKTDLDGYKTVAVHIRLENSAAQVAGANCPQGSKDAAKVYGYGAGDSCGHIIPKDCGGKAPLDARLYLNVLHGGC